jgi:hypothetical protein
LFGLLLRGFEQRFGSIHWIDRSAGRVCHRYDFLLPVGSTYERHTGSRLLRRLFSLFYQDDLADLLDGRSARAFPAGSGCQTCRESDHQSAFLRYSNS